MDLSSLLAENQKRKEKYFGYYNPLSGEGSLIKRVPLSTGMDTFLIPESMTDDPLVQAFLEFKDVDKVLETLQLPLDDKHRDLVLATLSDIRFDNDFEFWAAACVKIQDKESKKPVPFIMNYPQRVLLEVLERMRVSGIPIRIVLLKARQWGGSTLVQIYMGWFQTRLFTSWHSVIMADVEKQSRNIRGMYSKFARFYPKEIGKITLMPFEGATNTKLIKQRDCIIDIGSVQKPENTRSFDLAMAHLSEVGLWKSTPTRSAEDLAQALAAAIPRKPNTLIVKESTAKGVGNYFHDEWLAAEKGTSGYAPVFIPWYFIPLYVETVQDIPAFVESWTDYDKWQWEQGATIEGILWYRNFKAAERYSDWRMQSEYPTNAQEAFQSTGQRVFSPFYTANALKTCTDPRFIGELTGRGITGKESLLDIKFNDSSTGNFKVWEKPDHSISVRHRYCLFADIGGRTEKADFSVIGVADRYWMTDGGDPVVVAEWSGHLDQDLIAWKIAQIGTWYCDALAAVEINSLRDKSNGEGDHSFTILDEIGGVYKNLYSRSTPDSIKAGIPNKWGFATNHSSKGMIIDTLNGSLRDNTYVERNIDTYYELNTFEYKPDGTMGAVDGCKDDHVIVRAGLIWLALKYMPLPVVERAYVPKAKPKGGVSSF